MKISILLADDDELLRKLIKEVLEENKYTVYDTGDGNTALDILHKHENISLAILDIMMPGADGMEVLKSIRQHSNMPVIMLTAMGDSASELAALKEGANDYISKPFHYDILVARIQNLLNLTNAERIGILERGIMVVDQQEHRVYVNGESIILNNKEYQLLELLIRNEKIVLSRDTILERIWGYDYEGDIRTIDTHIKMLRSKMGEAGDYIKTIRGTGYLFRVTD